MNRGQIPSCFPAVGSGGGMSPQWGFVSDIEGLELKGQASQFRGLVVGRWEIPGWETNVRGRTGCKPRIIKRWSVGKDTVYVKSLGPRVRQELLFPSHRCRIGGTV